MEENLEAAMANYNDESIQTMGGVEAYPFSSGTLANESTSAGVQWMSKRRFRM